MRGLPPITTEGVLLGLGAVLVALVLSRLVRLIVERVLTWQHRSPSSAAVFGRLAGWAVAFLGLGAGLPHPEPTEQEVDAVLRASRTLVRIAARSIAPLDDVVTLPQYRMLLRLREAPTSGAHLAADLDVNPSTVVRMTDRLERKGLVRRRRREDDRRVQQIALTPDGKALIDGVTQRRVAELREALGLLTRAERAGLVARLQLLDRHDRHDAEGTEDPAPTGAAPIWPL